jgi:hypothetical protein
MFSLKRNPYLLFIFASLLIYNCSDTTEPGDSIIQLIPLKISNTWNYKMTSYDSTGTVSYYEDITSSIDKDTIIHGLKWYGYNSVPPGIWHTNKSDGYWSFVKGGIGNILNDTSLIAYKYPTRVGDIYGDPETPIEVLSVDEMITVPAGEFKVIHLFETFIGSTNYLLDSFETFITPGVGVIKVMQIGKRYDGTKFIVYKNELESYSLK